MSLIHVLVSINCHLPDAFGVEALADRIYGTRVAIYARVSSEDQVKNTSLGDQLDRCRTEATGRGWLVVDEFVEEGVSGTLLNRPALDRLLVQCRDGPFDVVMVAKLDRFSRDELTRLMIEREFRECEPSPHRGAGGGRRTTCPVVERWRRSSRIGLGQKPAWMRPKR